MFTLSTDTSCDAFKDELDRAGIAWIPLTFTIDGETHEDDFTRDEQYRGFYEKVRGGAMPTTSQISAYVHQEFFEKLIANGARDIVHLTLSSGLSSTYQSACIAAKEITSKYPLVKVNIVDSLGATQVHNMVLDMAKEYRDAGLSGEEAAAKLNARTNHIHVLFAVEDLKHLHRGGRVSAMAATLGTLFNIKPILSFDREGKLRVVHKAKGFRKVMDYVVADIRKVAPAVKVVYMAQGDVPERVAEATARLKEEFGCEVRAGWCGPVIGAHTGAGILGIIYESEQERPL